MQHHGGRSKDGSKVELLLELLQPGTSFPAEMFTGPDGKRRGVLHRIYRRPAGTLGCWVVFRYNGEEHGPDLSIPISVFKLPRDAERVPDDVAYRYWTTP